MLKKTISYVDYNGVKRSEDFYFNINKAELMEMEFGTTGGIGQKLHKMYQRIDGPEVIKFFKDLVKLSICEKSDDGRRLIKNDRVIDDFLQTEAYSNLLMELLSDPEKGNDFIKHVLPEDLVAQMNNPEVQAKVAELLPPQE